MNDFEAQQHDGETSEPELQLAIRHYVRFVALGDSASCGVGDPTPGRWREWARILADAIAADHHVSFCKLAVPGAPVADVRRQQLTEALDHRPVIASLVVGLNDAMRSTWDPEQIRQDPSEPAHPMTAPRSDPNHGYLKSEVTISSQSPKEQQ